MTTYCFI